MDKKYNLVSFNKEEGEAMVSKLNAFFEENMCDIKVERFIDEEGKIQTQSVVLKRVLIETVDPVIIPEVVANEEANENLETA